MEKYFKEEIIDTVNKIKALQNEGCFCFTIVADSHASPLFQQQKSCLKHTFENILCVHKLVDIDAIFHLGDLLFVNDDPKTHSIWTDSQVAAWFHMVRGKLSKANKNVFFIAGNHDGKSGEEPSRTTWHRTAVACQKEKITGYVKDEPYYYVDFPDARVRAICLMSNYKDNDEVYYGVYPEQVNWLKNDALLAPDDWNILLFSHICTLGLYETYPQDNMEAFVGFLRAFQEKKQFHSEIFAADFSQAPNARIAAMFVGHTHADWIEPSGDAPFPVIGTGSSFVHMPERGAWKMPANSTVPLREYDSVSEDLWDTVIFNPNKSTMDIIRFGAGEDRHIAL